MSRSDLPPRRRRPLVTLATALIAALIKLLCLTCRVVHVDDRNRGVAKKHGGRAVYCTWHQRMFYHFHCFGRLHVTMMISRSRDGDWAASIAHWLGFKSVRGSSRKRGKNKGGSAAMYKLIKTIKEQGDSAGIMADGPLGPARTLKMGAIKIARETGTPLLSEMWGCNRFWRFPTWDGYMIPKPFARICLIHGEPMYVPPDASHEEMEQIRQRMEARMNTDAARCDAYFTSRRGRR